METQHSQGFKRKKLTPKSVRNVPARSRGAQYSYASLSPHYATWKNTLCNAAMPPEEMVKDQKNTLIKQGNQPDGGQMNWNIERRSLPGHSDCDTIQIVFHFDDGIQSDKHPHPGHSYKGTEFVAYLPQNTTGTKILRLLEQAFEHKLLFTVAANSSGEYCVMPADIPLKTLDSGGPGSLGYPDPTYLKSVRKSLKVKGIK
ncbi:E3 ubiquitin-protein ligase DTX3L-like [Sinocyclocheilus anshuiensis]|uniref:E3 ubiquitin-protein ligase DTX3L-like n=1 Tax=Sinocyclocheilus anshuiensis TaxID=1608454 RepID=UPI0007B9B7EC|nr:PREDICTED: E3 ubiquitin-protein ligase DTX3L-like [Sinocyclocheilus anshuiensis]